MKANAPEKLYLIQHNGLISYCRNNDDDIEYVRKDALIKKACDLFRRIDYDDTIPPYETTEEFIEVFKNYMKE